MYDICTQYVREKNPQCKADVGIYSPSTKTLYLSRFQANLGSITMTTCAVHYTTVVK